VCESGNFALQNINTQMKNSKHTMKTLVFSLVLAALTLTANNMIAQNDGSRGLFGMGGSSADLEYSSGSLMKQGEPNVNGGITNDDFGTPLGSGIVILLGAGLGYVALKKKEDEQ
jgi:hypothetical protein